MLRDAGLGFAHSLVVSSVVIALIAGLGAARNLLSMVTKKTGMVFSQISQSLGTISPWWRGWLLGFASFACAFEVVSWVEGRMRTPRPRRIAISGERGTGTESNPRLARDNAWARLISQARSEDERLLKSQLSLAEASFTSYECGGTQLYGALFVAKEIDVANSAGVVLYHTAAGPRDLFLHWKAQVLAAQGCVVLVADLYGDRKGDAWEADFASAKRAELNDLSVLRARAQAAIDALLEFGVSEKNLAAMGWCLGGRAVVEMLKAGESRLKAVCSFHGVLDPTPFAPDTWPQHTRILAFHGDKDPFVPRLDEFRLQMRQVNAKFDLLIFAGAQHGFTNPGQQLNERNQFGYDERAATISWRLAEGLLSEVFTSPDSRTRL